MSKMLEIVSREGKHKIGRLGCARVVEGRVGIIVCSVEIRWKSGAIES